MDGSTICQLEGRRFGAPYNIELSQLLRNEAPMGTFADIWEDVFYSVLVERPGAEFLQVIASAGAAIALKEEKWPHFSHNTEVVAEFRKRLPQAAQKPYLLYCKKDWGQSGAEATAANDFGKWCDFELEYVSNSHG